MERLGVMDGVPHRRSVTHGSAHTTHVHAERLHERLAVLDDFLLRLDCSRSTDAESNCEGCKESYVRLHGAPPGARTPGVRPLYG